MNKLFFILEKKKVARSQIVKLESAIVVSSIVVISFKKHVPFSLIIETQYGTMCKYDGKNAR
jgi:hypothetical protein